PTYPPTTLPAAESVVTGASTPTPRSVLVATATPPNTPTAITTPSPIPSALPARPSPQQIVARDKNGALTASTKASGELSTEFTPANGFYITTKNAGGDPVIDRDKWRMVLDGEVATPVQIDLATLYQLPS